RSRPPRRRRRPPCARRPRSTPLRPRCRPRRPSRSSSPPPRPRTPPPGPPTRARGRPRTPATPGARPTPTPPARPRTPTVDRAPATASRRGERRASGVVVDPLVVLGPAADHGGDHGPVRRGVREEGGLCPPSPRAQQGPLRRHPPQPRGRRLLHLHERGRPAVVRGREPDRRGPHPRLPVAAVPVGSAAAGGHR